MLENIDIFEKSFADTDSLEGAIDAAGELANELGFSSLIYDYSPVAITRDGDLMTPSCVCMSNVPFDMQDLWCNHGFYQLDPVQRMALDSAVPFFWSYGNDRSSTKFSNYITQKQRPLVSYLHDAGLTRGVTVPIQGIRGDLATFNVIWEGSGKGFELEAKHNLATLGLIGQVFHERACSLFSNQQRFGTQVNLTPRERECLRYVADGLSAKQTADCMSRAISTITQHLQAATKKLGAKNRLHAVTLAQHYRLLEH